MSPLCESYVPAERLAAMEPFYPLHVRICERCLLVQLEEFVAPEEIFTEYAYFSSYSDSWVAHARGYVEMAVERFGLGRRQPRGGARQQRRLPAPARRRARHTGARNRAGRQRRRGGTGARDRNGRGVLRPRAGGPPRGRGPAGGPDGGEQRDGARPRPERLRRRHGAAPGAPGRGHHRGAPPRASRRGQPVRHDLSRALLLLLVPDGQAGSLRARPRRLRRRRARHPRRIAAPLRAASVDRSPAG